MKVLFICKKRNNSYGISVGLSNSAKFVASALNKRGIESEVISVNDAHDIDREVTQRDPKFVILEALWITPEQLRKILVIKRHQHRLWTVRIHSKTPFLQSEGIAMEWIAGYNKLAYEFNNLSVSGNNIDFVDDLGEVTNTFVDYLPNIYEADQPSKTPNPSSQYLNVGCFGAIRPLKNHLEQAFVAVMFAERLGKKLRFHINASRTEQRGDEVLKNLRGMFATLPDHELVEHGWLDHDKFVDLASTMDVGMQVSLSESFNIVTADLVSRGVPVVVSTDVDWMPGASRAVPTDTQDILKKLQVAYRHPLASSRLNYSALKQHNKKAIKAWLDYFKSFERDRASAVLKPAKNNVINNILSWFRRKN